MEQEARQLVEAAARWLAAVPDSGAYAERAGEQESDTEESAGTRAGFGEDVGPEGGSGEDVGPEAGGEHLCRGCPWCRAKAAAGPIGADTLDSIAHLLSAAAESLSLFAQSRRDAQRHEAGSDSGPHDDQSDDSEGAGPWA